MRIKIVSNYDSDLNMFKSASNCYKNTTNLKLTYEDDYECLLVVNGYRGKIKCPRDRVFGVLQEPIGNSNYDRNLHYYCKTIFCQSREMFGGYKGICEGFLPMFYRRHETIHRDYFLNYKDIGERKKLCIIVSGISAPNNPNWQNHNYTKRVGMVKKLLDSSLDFDFYGRGWRFDDFRYKGVCENKHETLRRYEYSIAIENVCEKNYASEKLFDCILNNTVPLYYGCPNYLEICEKGSVVPIDIQSPSVIGDIKEAIFTNTDKRLNSVLQSKQNYFDKMNMFDLVERTI